MTMMDSIASLFSPRPKRASQDVRYRKGVILTFDQNSLANTVLVDGVVLTNLPLLGVAESSTLQPGDTVGIHLIGDKGAQTWMILGQLVVPNTPEATKAISLLNQLVFGASIQTGESTTSLNYTDLATVGPTVTVNVGPSGNVLLMLTALVQGGAAFAVSANYDSRMSCELSGANVLAAGDLSVFSTRRFFSIVDAASQQHSYADHYSGTSFAVLSGLNPGLTTFTCKYRSPFVTNLTWSNRSICVVRM